MTQAQLKTPGNRGPTIDSDRVGVEIAGSPRGRTKPSVRSTVRLAELRRSAADLADRGLKVEEAARQLCSLVGNDRHVLSEVYLAQLRYMGNRPAGHFDATATLGIIERALTLLPRPVPPFAPPRWTPPARRRFHWLGRGGYRAATGVA